MQRYFWVIATVLLMFGNLPVAEAASPWGKDYFPNIALTTQDGESVRFFDDLIKDKIVAINFIYTSCPDTCPLETAQLVKVQNILGDRMGTEVFFYSITIDPDIDTPQVLKEYRERFGAKWTFLTGDNADIIELRKKLGLYIEEIQDGSNNHNVSMIIGNQATGRWMKRSPFENTYILADQLGNWLNGWKGAQTERDYAKAPELRSIPRGEQLFRTRCATCHTITGVEPQGALGPDLLGVTRQRDMEWLLNWLRAPDQMLANRDPIAMALYEKYNKLAMPNMRLNQVDATAIISYIEEETQRLAGQSDQPAPHVHGSDPINAGAEEVPEDVVAVMNAWVRETDAKAKVHAGYMTLINVGPDDVTLVNIESESYDNIEAHEMTVVDGLMKMSEITDLVIPANGQFQFKPGGKHLMLKGPHQHFTTGQKVEMSLTFKSGRKQKLSINVAAR